MPQEKQNKADESAFINQAIILCLDVNTQITTGMCHILYHKKLDFSSIILLKSGSNLKKNVMIQIFFGT